jgi:hypothetical protein
MCTCCKQQAPIRCKFYAFNITLPSSVSFVQSEFADYLSTLKDQNVITLSSAAPLLALSPSPHPLTFISPSLIGLPLSTLAPTTPLSSHASYSPHTYLTKAGIEEGEVVVH